MSLTRFGGILLIVVAIAGCASARYQDRQEKNVTIHVKLGKEGLFTSTEIVAGINDIAPDCSSSYRGYIPLRAGANELGLATGQRTYLMVEIEQSKFRQKSSFSRGVLFTPGQGRKYEVEVAYVDEMFDLRLYEAAGKTRKPLDVVPASACRPIAS